VSLKHHIKSCCGCCAPKHRIGPCAPLLLLQYDDHVLQLFVSSLFLAGAFAALVGMWTCKKFGRRFTMIMGGLAFIIGEWGHGLLPCQRLAQRQGIYCLGPCCWFCWAEGQKAIFVWGHDVQRTRVCDYNAFCAASAAFCDSVPV